MRANFRKTKKIPEKNLIKKWNIITGDKVHVLFGKDKGKQGIVKKVLKKENRLIVEGLNLVKKHIKSSEEFKGGIFTKEMPIHYSQVSLIDPSSGKPTKIKFKFDENGKKMRTAKESGELIPKPPPIAYLKKIKERTTGPKDTPFSVANKRTFFPPEKKFIDDLD